MRRSRGGVAGALVALVVVAGGASASAAPAELLEVEAAQVPALSWSPCGGEAAAVECASAQLPLDHDDPGGEQVSIAVAKSPATDPARRLGSVFFNPGGPGAPAVSLLAELGAELFPGLNERFDVVAFDPRGVGRSQPAVDCQVAPEEESVYDTVDPAEVEVDAYAAEQREYAEQCLRANGQLLAHVSTANVARDLDALRAAVGDEQLTYLGFSYGSTLGATYATLFPGRQRALVLDGATDVEGQAADPLTSDTEQAAAFERALDRFAQACAADQVACSGFGGADPLLALDRLLARADAEPLPATGYAADPTPVTREDLLWVVLYELYAKQEWGRLGQVLAQADGGDASLVRQMIAEEVDPEDPDAAAAPTLDQTLAVRFADGDYPGDVGAYVRQAELEQVVAPHFGSAYGALAAAWWPVDDDDALRGPVSSEGAAVPTLVVGTTYDPATPYVWSQRLVEQLGNARLLTVVGDGHTAYAYGTDCVDRVVEAYLVDLVVPAEGTTCQQTVPFTAPEPVPAG